MYIPFGKNPPNSEEAVMLEKIGFDMSRATQQKSGYFYLEVPEDSKIHCYIKRISDYQRSINISFKGANVISVDIMQITQRFEAHIDFHFNKPNISNIPVLTEADELGNLIQNIKERTFSMESKL